MSRFRVKMRKLSFISDLGQKITKTILFFFKKKETKILLLFNSSLFFVENP